ncbi:MAG: S8 family serine peptidase [Anaerolineae bacterium]
MYTPLFTSNYPRFEPGPAALLPTPIRVGALPEYYGDGVVIAFIDAGFYPHPDIKSRIILHADASTSHIIEEDVAFSGNEFSWHGLMTSVIACGNGSQSNGIFRGIAPKASLVLVKVSTPKGQIKEADILRGLRWVIDTHKRLNIRIVNISVGGDFRSDDPYHPLHDAIHKLTHAGVVVVAAAGNQNVDHLLPPASASEAITVGGIDDHNTMERDHWTLYHHNHGHIYDNTLKPDILATAQWIPSPILPNSTVAVEAHWLAQLLHNHNHNKGRKLIERGRLDLGLTDEQLQKPDDELFQLLQNRINAHKIIDAHHQHVDGTSVAAPIVTSIIAQMLEANPRLTPREIRAILTATAKPLTHAPKEKQGAGVIDAAAAVQMSLTTAQPKRSSITL